MALEPGIRALIARGRSRGLAALIVGGGALLGAALLAAVFGKLFFDRIAAFVSGIPALVTSTVYWANSTFGTTIDANDLSSSLSLTPSNVEAWAATASGGVLGVVGSLASVLFDLMTVVVFGFYFAGDGPSFYRTLASGMNPRRQEVFATITEITTAKNGGYVVSKIILAGQAWLSLLPTARCSRCLRPSEAMHQATSRASFAPCRRSASNTASTNRYSTSTPDRSRLMNSW